MHATRRKSLATKLRRTRNLVSTSTTVGVALGIVDVDQDTGITGGVCAWEADLLGSGAASRTTDVDLSAALETDC